MEGTEDGDIKTKQTSLPKSEGLGHVVLWEGGQDAAQREACVADFRSFLFSIYFSTSPFHAHFSPFLEEHWVLC